MKKILSYILIITLVSICIAGSAIADSNLDRFDDLLTGSWHKISDSHSSITDNVCFFTFFQIKNFTYPAEPQKLFSQKEQGNIDYEAYLVEDAIGDVYLCLYSSGIHSCMGKLLFDKSGKTLIIISSYDGAYTIFEKE